MEDHKNRVISALISNLRKFSPSQAWRLEHPLIKEYVTSMDSPLRTYHGWGHLVNLLDEFDEFCSDDERQSVFIRAAILFHDSVYLPGAPDNEEKSCLFVKEFYPKTPIKQIQDLIIATKHTFPFEIYGDDRDLICDLDLSILGAPKDRFFEYRLEVAQEYEGVCTPEEFDRGTREFFRRIYDQFTQGYIFRTEYFRHRYERIARENTKTILGL